MHKINADSDFKKITWMAATLVVLATFIVFLPALQNGFVNWDDDTLVYENQLRSIDIPFIGWALTDVSTGLWYPMLWLSLSLDFTAWGLNPLGYHLTNIIFHSINTFLVFILLTRLLLTQGGSLDKKTLIAVTVAALLFGIHPLRVESVAWVTERKDVLYSLFFLVSLLVYLKYANTSLKRYYLLSLIFFTLSLMSKPMAVSLPAVLLILDFYPLRRLTWEGGVTKMGRILVEKLPFFLLSLLLTVLTILIHPSASNLQMQERSPLKGRIFMAGYSYVYYLFKLAFPFDMVPLYPDIPIPDFLSVEYFSPFIGFATIIFLSVWSSKRGKIFFIIWLYYMATLIPVLGQVGALPHADRYIYLPSLGPFLLLGSGVVSLFERWSKRRYQLLLITLLTLMTVMFGGKTIKQIAVWRNSIALWSHEINLFSDAETAYYKRGSAYGKIGNYQLSIKDFDRVIELNPRKSMAYNNRGNAYYAMENIERAINDYKKAVELDPKNAEAHYNLGVGYSKAGNIGQALIYYKNAATLGLKEAQDYLKKEGIKF